MVKWPNWNDEFIQEIKYIDNNVVVPFNKKFTSTQSVLNLNTNLSPNFHNNCSIIWNSKIFWYCCTVCSGGLFLMVAGVVCGMKKWTKHILQKRYERVKRLLHDKENEALLRLKAPFLDNVFQLRQDEMSKRVNFVSSFWNFTPFCNYRKSKKQHNKYRHVMSQPMFNDENLYEIDSGQHLKTNDFLWLCVRKNFLNSICFARGRRKSVEFKQPTHCKVYSYQQLLNSEKLRGVEEVFDFDIDNKIIKYIKK